MSPGDAACESWSLPPHTVIESSIGGGARVSRLPLILRTRNGAVAALSSLQYQQKTSYVQGTPITVAGRSLLATYSIPGPARSIRIEASKKGAVSSDWLLPEKEILCALDVIY
jgi:hypothetical protein